MRSRRCRRPPRPRAQRRRRRRRSRRPRWRGSAVPRGRWRAARSRECSAASTRRRPGTPLRGCAPLELVEATELVVGRGDDQLAGHAARRSPRLSQYSYSSARASDAKPGLQRAGLVIDAGMDHPARVARLVRGDGALALDHGDPRAVVAPAQLACDGKADDAGADDDDVALAGGLGDWGRGHVRENHLCRYCGAVRFPARRRARAGVTIRRHGEIAEGWLYDLWLGERLLDELGAEPQ